MSGVPRITIHKVGFDNVPVPVYIWEMIKKSFWLQEDQVKWIVKQAKKNRDTESAVARNIISMEMARQA